MYLIAIILLMYSAWVDQGKMKPCKVANTDVAPASKTTMKSMRDILISFLCFVSKLRSSTPANFHYAHEQYEIETVRYDSTFSAY